jgi:pimeloyl-ACP methyl ester carboxylesterase
MVLLHARPFGGTMWDRLPEFECDSVVKPTLYGLGDTIEEWASAVLGLCGDGPLVVVGNSVGGSCALEVARLAPDRVAALVLVGAKAAHRREPEYRDQAMQFLNEHGVAAAFTRYWEPLFGPSVDSRTLESARELALRQDVRHIARGTWAFHTRPDRADFARSWLKPLIVIEGDEDRPERGLEIAATAPLGEFHVVEESGHYAPLEQPVRLGELIERVIRDLATD